MTVTITPATHVADIVIANPVTASVFEHHQIDYCCHGRRPLADACADLGIPADDLIAELEQVGTTAAETAPTEDVAALIGHIVAVHHTYLRRELPRLGDLMGKVVNAHGSAHPDVHDTARLLRDITDDLLPHLAKEEQILFPLTIQLLGAVEPTSFHCGSVMNPISVMLTEHDRVGELLFELRHSTNNYTAPEGACPTWHALVSGLENLETDTHRHVHLENNVLFPAITGLEQQLH